MMPHCWLLKHTSEFSFLSWHKLLETCHNPAWEHNLQTFFFIVTFMSSWNKGGGDYWSLFYIKNIYIWVYIVTYAVQLTKWIVCIKTLSAYLCGRFNRFDVRKLYFFWCVGKPQNGWWTGGLSTWPPPLNLWVSIERQEIRHTICIHLARRKWFWSASRFPPVNAMQLSTHDMCLRWNGLPCLYFIIAVLYYCHVSRGHDGMCWGFFLRKSAFLLFITSCGPGNDKRSIPRPQLPVDGFPDRLQDQILSRPHFGWDESTFLCNLSRACLTSAGGWALGWSYSEIQINFSRCLQTVCVDSRRRAAHCPHVWPHTLLHQVLFCFFFYLFLMCHTCSAITECTSCIQCIVNVGVYRSILK